jgi:hypothetical protein
MQFAVGGRGKKKLEGQKVREIFAERLGGTHFSAREREGRNGVK